VESALAALVNWVWQGSVVALVATAILGPFRRISATTRYQLWWITLFIVLALPALSFLPPASSFQPLPADSSSSELAAKAGAGSVPGSPSWKLEAGSWMPLPWTGALLAFLWLATATVSLSRTAVALIALRRVKRAARPFPEACEARLNTWLLLRSLGRPARLVVSDQIQAAAVLGLTSPSIAIAPPTLEALDDLELDQIVVHEWAHVQRRDDLARLAQRIIVAFAGLHPAVWWIDRQLHLERETACDDWAVQATGSAKSLAVCLTKLAALPSRPSHSVLVPAALVSSELTARVVRLLDRHRNTSTMRTFGPPMLLAPVLAALAMAVASVELVVTSPAVPDARADATSGPTSVVASAVVPPSARSPRELPSGQSARPQPGPPRSRASVEPATKVETSTKSVAQGRPSRSEAAATSAILLQHHRDEQALDIAFRAVGEGQVRAEELPGTPVAHTIVPAPTDAGVAAGSPKNATPWQAAAQAGVTVGSRSQKAAVATAGFFTRVSKSISGVF
jgi:beta-lactamase regulating signal transducer with metallopeptidase domain